MGNFQIDFHELSFLAEACIPPRPIARMFFWKQLTDKYWAEMSEGERAHLFEWIQRNPFYEDSLKEQMDTKIFHARFNPDNQYMVKTNHNGVEEEHRAFKMSGDESTGFSNRYYVGTTKFIAEEYIISVNKFEPKREY